MDRWIHYMYEPHSERELKEWASRLHYFRYFRAYGGHANDADSLDIALQYESTQELINLLRSLGIEPTVYSQEPDQPISGAGCTADAYSSHPCLIRGTQWIKQPGHCEIWGVPVFIWCDSGRITISASPGSYIVTADHVEAAALLEKKLCALTRFIVDPPKDTKHYLCPKYHPSFFC